MNERVEVVEYTDPICSWAWGTEPKLRLLRWRHEHRCDWRVVMGGLVGDATKGRSDWDPERAAVPMSAYWKQTTGYTGQPYPSPMRRMASSTDPAGRAVKAALAQGADLADAVLRRLRESTFVFGVTPDDAPSFAAAVAGVPGLDVDRFVRDLGSVDVADAYRADWDETRRPNEHVRTLTGDRAGIGSMKHSEGHDRYAFPTLVFRGPGGEHTVPGWMPYDAYVDALESAVPGCTSDPRPDPTPAEALDRWGLLTEQELVTLCGVDAVDRLPESTVAHFWGAGLVYLSPAGAASRSLPAVPVHSGRSLADFAVALDLARSVVATITDDRWTTPTPCDGWDVRALVNHMTGSARMVTFGITGREIGPEFYGNHLGPDPIESFAAAAAEAVDTYRSDPTLLTRPIAMPWGSIDGDRLATMFAADQLVHAWDAATALGVELVVDDALVARIRAFGDAYADAHREPGMFGPAQPAPADATPIERLAAYVGRVLPA